MRETCGAGVDNQGFDSNELDDFAVDVLMKRFDYAFRTVLPAQAIAKAVFGLCSHVRHHVVLVLEWL